MCKDTKGVAAYQQPGKLCKSEASGAVYSQAWLLILPFSTVLALHRSVLPVLPALPTRNAPSASLATSSPGSTNSPSSA